MLNPIKHWQEIDTSSARGFFIKWIAVPIVVALVAALFIHGIFFQWWV